MRDGLPDELDGVAIAGKDGSEWGGQSRIRVGNYCSLAYSALACFRMGMSGSASFQRARKS